MFSLWLALPSSAGAVNSCNGLITIDYVSGPNFAIPGDVVRVRLTLGTGSIQGGTKLTVSRLRFDLDCNDNFALGIPCTDEGSIVRYEGDGTVTTTCGVAWTTGHAIAAAPNEVVFTPNVPVDIAPNQAIPPGFCVLEFDVMVLGPSVDNTPTQIQESTGFSAGDAMCDNGLQSTGSQSSSIPLCPTCSSTQCATGTCNQNTGQCVNTPKPSSTPCEADGNLCTIDHCDGSANCAFLDNVDCQPANPPCDGGELCDPQTGGCVAQPDAPLSTPCELDATKCTTDHCDGQGTCVFLDNVDCQPANPPCEGGEVCDPQTGTCVAQPDAQSSTPCPDNDGNVCSLAGCDGFGNCDQIHLFAPDSTPCPDNDGSACTAAGCNGAGTCDQQHVTNACPGDHYVCYNSSTKEPNPPDVTLVDQFETASFHPKRCHPKSFCAPASKNGSAISDPVTHLKGYRIRRIGGAEPRVTVDVTNQFGTIRLTTRKADRLLVPSSKSLTAPPPPPDPAAPGNQHYKCYTISPVSFAPVIVTAADQFGSRLLQLRKPVSLCTPVSKNGSEIKDPSRHLLCYSVRPATTPPSPVFVTNQFGMQTLNLSREGAFCVPSTKTIVP